MKVSQLIAKNFVWRVFFYGSALLLNIAVARKLGAELSGSFYFFLNDLSFALLIGSFSFESGITYYVSKKKVSENILASFSVVWSFLSAIIIGILVYIFYNDIYGTFGGLFIFFACTSYITGLLLTTYFTAFFYCYDNYKVSNFIGGSLNILLLLFIPWKRNSLNIEDAKPFFYFFFIFTLLQGVLITWAWFLRKKQGVKIKAINIKELSPVIRYSLTALIGNVAYFLLYRIDYWFVEHYCSAKSLGNYIQVSKLGQLFVLPAMIISATLFPQSSKGNISFRTPVFHKTIVILVVAYLLGTVIFLLIGNPLIFFLWGGEYDEMYCPLIIILPGIMFLAVSILFAAIFAGKGKVNINVYISLFTLVIVIISNILFIPRMGIKGAAFATSIGFLGMMSLYVIIANKRSGLSVRTIRNKADDT